MSARVLVIDNYDSFTFNLVQYLGELGAQVTVVRNDAIDVAGIRAHAPDGLLLSPGPCSPNEAGITLAAIDALKGELPILGVCLGHQALGQALGGRVVRAAEIVHGKASAIQHLGVGVFEGLPQGFQVGRYHSLTLEPSSLPPELEVTATVADGTIMGVRHRSLELEGVQFHPESILTEHGHAMLGNWLRRLVQVRDVEAAVTTC
ncbi:MAG TPA: aminodeoxychorismate/anthranilate synthase component II [Myxococcaceae bacterium]|nr:aminodeoxychorismate/anthranilate synthase component II [Myxococcaceae bacterium]